MERTFPPCQKIKERDDMELTCVVDPLPERQKEADEMIAISKEKGKVLAVHQQHRFAADYVQLKEILDSGILGKIYRIIYRFYQYKRRSDWQSLKKMGGGTLSNTGPPRN